MVAHAHKGSGAWRTHTAEDVPLELNMPGWIVSPRWRKSHITAPQETAAKTVKYRESGGNGLVPGPESADWGEELYGVPARGINEATTRDTT